jgi:hypothetical protein
MSRSIQLCVLAGGMTLADLVVFIHCVPIVCQAWGSNCWIMCALFAGMVVSRSGPHGRSLARDRESQAFSREY